MALEKESQPRVIVIGAGMAGILTVIRLLKEGYQNFVVYEKSDRIGGTWRENTYPGIACDVPAHLYTYSFEPNPEWSQTFAPGREIQAYFERVARKYDVFRYVRFSESVDYCAFENGSWLVRTSQGREDNAKVLIAATGVLHHPNVAQIDGLDTFRGTSFHSANWDHGVPLENKRVGVVGTGSTAIQITTALAARTKRYDLYQRTAQWVMKIDNSKYSAEEKAGFLNDREKLQLFRNELSDKYLYFANAVIDADSPEMLEVEHACRENLEQNVHDPILREKLTPNYRAGCKRLIFSPNFYESIQSSQAHVITTPIEKIEQRGVRLADGELRELDVLVLATGFRAANFIRPTTVVGSDGVNLNDVWADHPVAYLSISVPGFPNFFMLNGPNGPVGNFSLIQIAESQIDYILKLIDQIRQGQCKGLSANEMITREYEKERGAAATKSIWASGCKSWYLDKNGVPASWPWSPERFFYEMEQPKLADFDRV